MRLVVNLCWRNYVLLFKFLMLLMIILSWRFCSGFVLMIEVIVCWEMSCWVCGKGLGFSGLR